MTRVRDALGGKQFFITGATGFLGTALVERLLRTVPDSRVVLLIRPGRRSTPAQRATKEILKNDCFDRLREEHGDRFEAEVAGRVSAVAGDVATDGLGLDEEGLQLLSECDIVIHSAAAVSFDSPLDSAVEVNLLGPSRVAAAVVAARQLAAEQGRTGPVHYLPVSTAYVAGTHQGEAREELLDGNPFSVDVDWRTEVDAARRQRGDLDAESRRPERLATFAKAARRELGGAGLHLLAERAERLREDWVKKQMVAVGPGPGPVARMARRLPLHQGPGRAGPGGPVRRHRAHDHHPPLDHRVGPGRAPARVDPRLPDGRADHRLLRPRAAPGVPGVPEGVTDVIPVDLVVAAIIAVAGEALLSPAEDVPGPDRVPRGLGRPEPVPLRPPGRTGPGLVHRAPPLRLRRPAHRGARVVVPRAGSGPAPAVPGQQGHGRGREGGRAPCPSAGARPRGWPPSRSSTCWPTGPSATSSSTAPTPRPRPATGSTGSWPCGTGWTPTTARRSASTRPRSTGTPTSATSTCPRSSSTPGCARRRASPTQPSRADRARKAILSPDRHLAAFDLENTLIASNVVDSYAWLASRHLPAGRTGGLRGRPGARGAVPPRPRPPGPRRLPPLLLPPLRGCPGGPAARRRVGALPHLLLAKSFPAGIARVRQHRALGHRTILITGALDLVVEPLRPLFDDIVCARLGEDDGKLHRAPRRAAPHRRGPGPGAGRLRRGRGAATRGVDGLRRLGQRPAHAGGGRASRWPSTPRPSWPPSPGGGGGTSSTGARPTVGSSPLLPLGPLDRRGSLRRGRDQPGRTVRGHSGGSAVGRNAAMKALVFERNLPRFAASRVASVFGSGRGAGIGPLQLCSTPTSPSCPATTGSTSDPCCRGSAAATWPPWTGAARATSRTWSASPSSPATRWSGVLDDGGVDHAGAPLAPGTRAVIEPVLGCAPRHIRPLCPHCAAGHTGLCGNVAFGAIEPGLQTGFCADTGGGWSTAGLVAHASQLHAVPDDLLRRGRRDGRAHRLRRPRRPVGRHRRRATRWPWSGPAPSAWPWWPPSTTWSDPTAACTVMVGAKHAHQRELAESLGADMVVPPDQLARAVRRRSGSLVLAGRLTDGADVVFDCVGSSESVTQSLAMVRPRGRVVLVGMPGRVSVDLAPLWHRELTLVGAYAYGDRGTPPSSTAGPPQPELRRTFELAIDLVAAAGLGSLVTRPPTRSSATRRPSPTPGPPAAGGGQGGLRPTASRKGTHPMSPRPGFVLDVDRSTPPTLFWHGERFSLERLPEGSRVIYAPEPIDPLKDPAAAIRYGPAAIRSATASRFPALLRPGMKLTIAFDDISLPLPPMERPDIRQMVIEQVLDMAAEAGVDDVALIVALALHRRMTEAELRHALGDRIYDAFAPNGLLTQHDAEDPDALVHLGLTDQGEDVEINKRAAESDLLVYVNINLVAMDGGHKSVATGLASYRSLRHHHNR